jgi:drug/metabolite transporter, DME family
MGAAALDGQERLFNNPTMPARVQVLVAAVCFGTTGTAQAIGPSASPVAVGAARIVVGGALLVVIARALRLPMPRRSATTVGIAVGVCIYQLSFFAAVKLTGVAVGTVVAIGTGPAAAGLLGRLVNGERLTRRWALATLAAAAGVALLAGDGGGTVDPGGIALAVTAGAGYATCTVLSKRLILDGAAPEGVMAAGFGGAAVLLVPVLLVAGPGFLTSAGGLGLALYLGAIPTAVAYVLFSRGLRGLTSGETATLVLAEPLTAAALGVVALGEQPSMAAGAGAALVLAGLAILALPARRAVEPAVAVA